MNIPQLPHRVRIAVFLGGGSDEREISLESGRNVVHKLHACGHTITPIFVTPDYQFYPINQTLLAHTTTRVITDAVRHQQPLSLEAITAQTDFVFLALHGGLGENGTLQGALDLLHMPYNGSGVAASALCMDKAITGTLLRAHGIATPQEFLIDLTQELAHVPSAQNLMYPVIIKPHNNGCSVDVMLVHNETERNTGLAHMRSRGLSHALVQEYIQGMELTVGVLGNDDIIVLPASACVRTQGVLSIEEKFLPGAGENQTPAPLPDHVAQLLEHTIAQTYRAMGCRGYARIDCFWQDPATSPTGVDRIVILEINTLPGLTPATCLFHQAAEWDITPSQLLETIVAYGMQAQQQSPVIPGESISTESTHHVY